MPSKKQTYSISADLYEAMKMLLAQTINTTITNGNAFNILTQFVNMATQPEPEQEIINNDGNSVETHQQ